MSPTLVTGGTGFLAGHTIAQLLSRGDTVRATVRSLDDAEAVRRAVASARADLPVESLEFAVADLTADAGWDEAAGGCDAVLHLACPHQAAGSRDLDGLVGPARDGTLRVLRAAQAAGIRRVVMTSALAAIQGAPVSGRPHDERDWTNPDRAIAPFARAKTLAERAAWEYVDGEGDSLELVVLNPAGILGPVLSPRLTPQLLGMRVMLRGTWKWVLRSNYFIVDVRDVAHAHLLALDTPGAAHERFILAAPPETGMLQIAQMLKAQLGDEASEVSTRVPARWRQWLGGIINPRQRQLWRFARQHQSYTLDKATDILGFTARDQVETITDAARSLIDRGLV